MHKLSKLVLGTALVALVSATMPAQGHNRGHHGGGGGRETGGGCLPLPEPMTMSLLALGAAGVGLASRRSRKQRGVARQV